MQQSNANPKTVWVVSEGSPGHDSQSHGLASALADALPMDIHAVRARATVRGWMRPLVRAWMGRRGRPLSPMLLSRVTDMEPTEDLPVPDLVISSGINNLHTFRTNTIRN